MELLMPLTVRSVLRSVGAVLAGFAVITLGTVLTFTVLVSDFGYRTSSNTELLIGTLGALTSGLAGGLLAGLLAARRRLLHAAALAIPIALDTASIVVSSGPGSDPLWFDLGGSLILLVGALAGGFLIARRRAPSGLRTPRPG
jgi:hypothetical protein